jgi:hypothetical protein
MRCQRRKGRPDDSVTGAVCQGLCPNARELNTEAFLCTRTTVEETETETRTPCPKY